MKKVIQWMSEVFGPNAAAFGENPWISSVQETMISAIPVMIISSFVTIVSIVNEYVPGFPDFSYLSSFTMGLSSLMVAYLLPTIVDQAIRSGKAKVRLLETKDKWFGVTYKEDKPAVVAAIRKLIEEGVYPAKLFED